MLSTVCTVKAHKFLHGFIMISLPVNLSALHGFHTDACLLTYGIFKEMKLLFLVQQPEGYYSKDFLSAELLLIFDQEPENVAASTSKANTIESLPANKKSDCVYPLKRVSTR